MAAESVGSLLYKGVDTVQTLARRRPSLSTLRRNRRQEFTDLHAIVPSTVTTDESVSVTVQPWDQCERTIDDFTGSFHVDATDEAATVPDRITFPTQHSGVATIPDVSFGTVGTQYLLFTHADSGRRFVSNPVRVTADEPEYRLYWGDLHLHSIYSDGCGTVEEGLAFGKRVMDLDVVAYADHDTMGFFIPPRLQRRRMRKRYFDRTKAAIERFHEPGEYVTIFGYEWTKQPTVGGHVNVYFDDVEEATLFDSIAAESNTYEKLWDRLREFNEAHETTAISIPHHTAESTFPFDFSAMEYDDELAPLVEVYSQWGSSEKPASDGNRQPIRMGQGEADEPGYYVQDALELGNRVGMVAGADFHGARPGHSLIHADPHIPSKEELVNAGLGWGNIWRIWNEPSYAGGLQAFWAPSLTRDAIFDALQSRRTYGTAQPHRIVVDFRIDGVRVGENDSEVAVDGESAGRSIVVDVAGTAPISAISVVKNNEEWRRYDGTDDEDADLATFTVDRTWRDDEPITGMAWDDERGTDADVYYVRVRQADDGMAWAGPLWVSHQ